MTIGQPQKRAITKYISLHLLRIIVRMMMYMVLSFLISSFLAVGICPNVLSVAMINARTKRLGEERVYLAYRSPREVRAGTSAGSWRQGLRQRSATY